MTTQEILIELARMVGNVAYFPAEPVAVANIAMECARFIEDRIKLTWLVDVFIHQVGSWKGTKEFRAVYCTRFRPMDGLEAWSDIIGFTAADSESLTHERHMQLTAEEKEQRKLTASKPCVFLPLPPEEIQANQELKSEIHKVVRKLSEINRLQPEENYQPPDWLQ